MGWGLFNKALDDALPKKDDSPSDTLGKMIVYPMAGLMAIFDLFEEEPSSGGGGGGQQSGGGGCHCNCPDY